MNDETPSFQINDVVTWTTYRNGGTQHHIGKIFAIIPPFVKAFGFKEGDSHYTLPDGQYVSIFKTEYDYRNVLPRIESVWAVLKRGFYGVYHQFSEKHLQRYVDEFAYRLNEGNCKVHTLDRIDALIKKTNGVRLTYTNLIGATS